MREHGFIGGAEEAGLLALHRVVQGGQFAGHVGRVAFGIGFGAFGGETHQRGGLAERQRAGRDDLEEEVAGGDLAPFGGQAVEFLLGVERFGECGLARGPRRHSVVLLLLSGDDVAAREPGQLTLRVGVAVVEALQSGGDGDGAGRVAPGRVFDGADPLAIDLVAQLEAEVALVGHFAGGHGAHRAPGISQHHDEIARFDAAVGDREEELGLVGLAVLVGAAQRKIAGVARPAEVVRLAAEFADGARRGVDQADVGELDGFHQHVLQAAIEGGHAATHAGRLLAGGHQRLLFGLDGFGARQVAGARGHGGFYFFGDVGELMRHGDARGLAGQFLLAVARDEAIGDEVAARAAVFLHDAEQAVMIGEEEAGGGDEPGRAAARADGGGQQSGAARGVPQSRDGQFQSLLFEPLRRELQQLLGCPLALFGGGESDGDAQAGGPSEGLTELHRNYQDKPSHQFDLIVEVLYNPCWRPVW